MKSKYNSSTYFKSPKKIKFEMEIDSDTSLSHSNNFQEKELVKSSTHKALASFPVISQRKFKREPKIIDFSINKEEMNANQLNEHGKPHFDLNLDHEKFMSISPLRSKQSKLREYYNTNLWGHMNDFRQDGKTKIKNIRRKYRNLLSPEVTMKKIINPRLNIQDTISEPPIIFAKREYNDQFRYEQLKEIDSLKDHLAKEGIPCDTKTLRRAILMPEDII